MVARLAVRELFVADPRPASLAHARSRERLDLVSEIEYHPSSGVVRTGGLPFRSMLGMALYWLQPLISDKTLVNNVQG
jgi:hypothetical protein